MYANYHTHTSRCKHAQGEDREYVEAAIEAGMRILGFSDHCPWVFPDDYVSGIRMDCLVIDSYFDSLIQLREEYADDIRLLIGFESEYVPELMEAQDHLFANYPLDYMILGQHFLGIEEGSVYMGNPTEDESVLEQYVDMVIEGMDSGRYAYLAHPDLVHFVGNQEVYDFHMRRMLSYLLDNSYPVEINMLGALQGRHYPNARFLELAGEMGNACIIGVDAHSPDLLKNREGELLCRQMAERYGLRLRELLLI